MGIQLWLLLSISQIYYVWHSIMFIVYFDEYCSLLENVTNSRSVTFCGQSENVFSGFLFVVQ